jgi:hypothetical protein
MRATRQDLQGAVVLDDGLQRGQGPEMVVVGQLVL